MQPLAAARLLAVAALLVLAGPAAGQVATEPEPELAPPEQAVSVEPLARDEAIERRIEGILEATGWYRGVAVEVEDGVVFLDGTAGTEDHRTWARELAAKTQDVVAVVNRIRVRPEIDWDFGPALRELGQPRHLEHDVEADEEDRDRRCAGDDVAEEGRLDTGGEQAPDQPRDAARRPPGEGRGARARPAAARRRSCG